MTQMFHQISPSDLEAQAIFTSAGAGRKFSVVPFNLFVSHFKFQLSAILDLIVMDPRSIQFDSIQGERLDVLARS